MQHTGLLELHGEVTELFSYDAQPYKATANVVCAGCNNGWMSRSEEGAKGYLVGMVEGRGRELHAGGLAELARWALCVPSPLRRAAANRLQHLARGLRRRSSRLHRHDGARRRHR